MIDKEFRICSTDGKEKTRIDLISKLSYGANRVVYHRQDLHDVLKEAATSSISQAPGAKIRVSSRVVSANCLEGSVMLENGEVLEGFDVVIGADGIRSMIRGSVLEKEVNAVPTGVSAYRMIISAKSIEDDEQISNFLNPRDSCTTMVVGHDCRLIMGPARNGEIYSIVAMVPDGKYIFTQTKVLLIELCREST
jgi:salicylate hydroxylase